MTSQIDYTKVPEDRLAVVIGKNGKTKEKIEEITSVELSIDSSDSKVEINRKNADPVLGWKVKMVIKAIGRGFTPKKALKLLEERETLELIKINDFANTKDSMHRLKGRVIGSNGKSRELLEEISKTDISVYGKTIGVIGKPERVAPTIEAIKKILNGSPHGNAYKYLKNNVPNEREISYIRKKQDKTN